jgi:hypothetical protein
MWNNIQAKGGKKAFQTVQETAEGMIFRKGNILSIGPVNI